MSWMVHFFLDPKGQSRPGGAKGRRGRAERVEINLMPRLVTHVVFGRSDLRGGAGPPIPLDPPVSAGTSHRAALWPEHRPWQRRRNNRQAVPIRRTGLTCLGCDWLTSASGGKTRRTWQVEPHGRYREFGCVYPKPRHVNMRHAITIGHGRGLSVPRHRNGWSC